MYGKKRITIEKTGMIVLSGNKSYIPIGRYYIINGEIVGKLRNVGSYDIKLNETNSIDFKFANTSQLRNFVKSMYLTELKN
jgi:hypothetical protein